MHKIQHPVKDGTVTDTFAAFGLADVSVNFVKCHLEGKSDGTITPGDTLFHPADSQLSADGRRLWLVHFRKVDTSQKHKLHLEDRDHPGTDLDSADNITVKQRGTFGVSITYPKRGTVCPAFHAYGTADPGGTVSGTLNGYAGTPLQNGQNWVLAFNVSVTQPTAYTLTVTVSGSGSATSNITVDPNVCA
jgi:hypothetical protein